MSNKKMIPGLVVLGLISVILLSRGLIVQAVGDITVSVTSYFDETSSFTTEVTGQTYGTKVSFSSNLSTQSGYSFVTWILNGVVRTDLAYSNLFIVTNNTDITAVFRPNDKYAAIFLDSNGQVLDIQYVSPGASASDLPIESLPSKPGYEIAVVRWNQVLTNLQGNRILVLQYVPSTTDSYLVSVINGTGAGTYAYNSVATVVADDPDSGMFFSHWRNGDRVVSHQSTYSFSVLEAATLEAVYTESSPTIQPFVTLSNNLGLREGYQSFLGQHYLPVGYELIEYGVITSPTSGLVIDLSTVGITRHEKSICFATTNEWVMSFLSASVGSIRAYLTVKDSNGNLMTVYNEMIVTAPSYTYASDLFFSYYIEGSSNNKALAIFNGTGSSVDLSTYSIKLYANGTSTATSTIALSGTLVHGAVYVIANTSSNATILAMADLTSGVLSHNGDDALQLLHGTTVIDIFGQVGFDPGTAWVSGIVTTLDRSLIRKSSVTTGRISTGVFDPAMEWDVYPIDTTTGLDSHIMTNMGPEGGSSSSKTVSSMETWIPNFSYMVGDSLNLTDAWMKVYYSDGSADFVPLTAGMISGFSTTSAGIFTLTVTYESKTDTVAYVVSAIPSSATLIIHEVYGGGGNVGATYTNDYVVLYNNTTSDINLSGYSIQYAASTSSSYSVLNLNGTIAAKNYFLISLSSGGAVGSPLPTANQSGTLSLSATAGKIALVDDTLAITIATDVHVLDFIGYGTANESETAPTATLSSSLSAKRSSATDTDDNSFDFVVATPNLSYLSASVTLESLSVANLPTYYELNDPLVIGTAKLILHYSNLSTEEVALEASMVSNFITTSLGTFNLTITYDGVTMSYEYYVVDYSSLTSVEIHAIDLGYDGGGPGESYLIQVGGIDILIDSGEDGSASEAALLAFLASNVTDGIIEYIIATHPDADHIGGFNVVFAQYAVTNVIRYSTDVSASTALRTAFEAAIVSEGSTLYTAYALATAEDPTMEIATGVLLRFYNTSYLTSSTTNASSIVFVLEAFNTRVLFNGDAEGAQEAVYAPLVGDVDIFKMGHHGSSAGTTSVLLDNITPEVAIVNNGDYLGNIYNHPTYEALSRIYTYSNLVPIYSVTGGNGSSATRMSQRNGAIAITVTGAGYSISSEYYDFNPMEISNTDYWKSLSNPYRTLSYYYALSTGILDGGTLKAALSNVIDGHTALSYTGVINALKIVDADPNVSGNILLFYTNRSQSAETFVGSTNDQDFWNREHIWAQSHGIDEALPAYTDLHHLRATDVSVNAERGNLDFGVVVHNATTLLEDTYGTVVTYNYLTSSYFEPRDEIKGDVARMLFYMATRYEGNNGEVDLELANGITTVDSSNIGDLATLLLWNELDPVDDAERNRNDLVFSFQNNRNPFIDHPELVKMVYGN